MSKAITHSRIISLFAKWNIPYKVYNSKWYEHNRNHKGPWGVEMNGTMIHHTGSSNQTTMPSLLWNGYDDLPGPVCHGGIDIHGVVHLVGWGRANHAGLGDDDVLRHVIAEDYDASKTLKPNEANTDGNRHFYGWEVMYDGTDNMTNPQYSSMIRVQAAICAEHNWTEKSAIGHGEWQPGKWDPGFEGHIRSMGQIRSDIHKTMKAGPNPKTPVRLIAPTK